ncbi:uncharacterized protein LOC110047241 [Orbicella faveolata]|uniref:uncharacterized protein LOC110047241 n=1 Tax=Orbicella faveolata TaxID=48498 RepID=UPI0009E43FD5|nr:uncharacterized protein LOC110047241 [Orbicella faveolata]
MEDPILWKLDLMSLPWYGNEDGLCVYVVKNYKTYSWDWIGLYRVGFQHLFDYEMYEWAVGDGDEYGENGCAVLFDCLPEEAGHYVMCYYSYKLDCVISVSDPFEILPPRDEDKDPVEVQVEQPTEDVCSCHFEKFRTTDLLSSMEDPILWKLDLMSLPWYGNEDGLCVYVVKNYKTYSWDWIGLYRVGFQHLFDYEMYEWAVGDGDEYGENGCAVLFDCLPEEAGHYVMCYYSYKLDCVISVSDPFEILPPRDEDKDPVEVQVEQPTEDV